MYYTGKGDDIENHDTTIYWCLRTFKPIGPDTDPCTKATCRPDRGCFEGDAV